MYQVDAFTAPGCRGNPAAVCLLEDWPADSVLQSIAEENNLSETAFVLPRDGDFELRWFTPKAEVDLCGHATLGAAYVLATYASPGRDSFRFHTRSGPLEVFHSNAHLTMDFPLLRAEPVRDRRPVADALGVEPLEVWRETDLVAVLPDEQAVWQVEPNLVLVEALDGRGVIVTAAAAEGAPYHFVSRFFAPRVGIPEDPVTGSAHCLLAPYWAERLGVNPLLARQVSARGGGLQCEVRGERVLLTGKVTPYLEGRIRVEV